MDDEGEEDEEEVPVELRTHSAWVPPVDDGGCCACGGLAPECPEVVLEVKTGSGEAFRPSPCGFLVEGEYYLTKTTTRTIETMEADPQPRLWECELVTYSGGTVSRYAVSDDEVMGYDVEYNTSEVSAWVQNEDGTCDLLDTEVETDDYHIRQRVNILHGDSGCEGPPATPNPLYPPPAGGDLDEVDPENSTEEVDFADPYVPMSDGEITALAMTRMTEALDAAEWGDGFADSYATILADEDGVIAAGAKQALTRWRVTGGNTGYLLIRWAIRDENDEIVATGEVEHFWDPAEPPDNEILGGPDLDFPGFGEGNSWYTRTLEIVETLCLPA